MIGRVQGNYAASFLAAAISMFTIPDFPDFKIGSGKWFSSEEEKKLSKHEEETVIQYM
jgi:hypothetical protein